MTAHALTRIAALPGSGAGIVAKLTLEEGPRAPSRLTAERDLVFNELREKWGRAATLRRACAAIDHAEAMLPEPPSFVFRENRKPPQPMSDQKRFELELRIVGAQVKAIRAALAARAALAVVKPEAVSLWQKPAADAVGVIAQELGDLFD